MSYFWIDTIKISNEELADLIHELNDKLEHRCQNLSHDNWLTKQLNVTSLKVRSWSQRKKNFQLAQIPDPYIKVK